ncbi:hypothetical protein OOT46_28685 [Aquabacterium sp. A7-Y]|uniref:hypothetical protein n=1 Tax=Aquabacterium sp. A7-Y TaxID=1349605 RepID=UPI00223E688C|nr:hypothetical protein [Aquabacterium sp. A7-Y]MCW7541779.1 hypothetical protein [Aquabacterium sp. A7-Y]
MGTLYRKTEKGQAEIATRQNHLAQKLRSGLIVVDGKRSEAELMRLIPQHPEEVIETLLAEGYIEIVGPSAQRSSPSRSAAADTPPAPHPLGRPVEQLRSRAVRFIGEQLGPLADQLATRMEKARSWDELQPLLLTAHRILADNRGGATAEAFKVAFLEQAA